MIGSGGFGTVYRAIDRELRRPVAIKVPHEGILSRPQEVKRFAREALTASKLNHPQICRIFDLGEVDGVPYIVMSLLQGETLKQFLARGKRVTPCQAVYAIYKLTNALSEAHGQGIVHRDLKPSNIMVDAKRRELIILDFGLAREMDARTTRLTITGEILGNPPTYTAPEQVRGHSQEISPRTDVYSLGVVLYEMATGEVPFDGSMAEVFAKILYEPPRPPSMCRSDIHSALDGICAKAMAKEPADRYESMEAFRTALAGYLKPKKSSDSPVPSATDEPALDIEAIDLSQIEVQVPGPKDGLASLAIHKEMPLASGTAVCPSCHAPLPDGALLCSACGFHKGMNQRFAEACGRIGLPDLKRNDVAGSTSNCGTANPS